LSLFGLLAILVIKALEGQLVVLGGYLLDLRLLRIKSVDVANVDLLAILELVKGAQSIYADYRRSLDLDQLVSRPLVQASLFISRATVQSILDSATGQSTLKSALQSVLDSGDQLILKSTIQSILNSTRQSTPESTTQPVPESTDTRPIWPGRPELIYRRYLAEKEAWLIAHPDVQPAKYRAARGLEKHSQRWCNENRRYLGYQRLDLETETLLEDSPDWTNEEIEAWLDWDAQETIEVEQQVEAELIAAGGFGRQRDSGLSGLMGRLRIILRLNIRSTGLGSLNQLNSTLFDRYY
jgi:hypothetical protein